ncbi:hypothetical protein BCR43DRAFT_510836 [Syncephalastrum racemosum]|uniref:Uncharacterized protein n=1 Tax=Syncephalastrum racemosum TaxID=13706 RepID=A0A1X2HWA8_SYNRA|nr:hypothetical protein BCR43DRAFT_510836 [Syncephalastrum racemosum]
MDISDDACSKLARIVTSVDSKQFAKDDADIELLMLGKSMCPIGRCLARGVSAAMRCSPLAAIEKKPSIGKYASVMLMLLDFGPSLGYGEVKTTRRTTDNHALCRDLCVWER